MRKKILILNTVTEILYKICTKLIQEHTLKKKIITEFMPGMQPDGLT